MKLRTISIVLIVLVSMFLTVETTTEEASASVSDVEFISEAYRNHFAAWVDWTFTSYDEIEIRLYHNSIVVDVSWEYIGSSGDEWDAVFHEPIQEGKYKVQLWSNYWNTEIDSKEYEVPSVDILMAVFPISGQIGTTFMATTTISAIDKSPDYNDFSGSLEITANDIVIKQSVGGVLYSENTGYDTSPIVTSTGFTFSSAGEYIVSAQYTDAFKSIDSTPVTVTVTDQYSSQITELNDKLKETNDGLNNTMDDLEVTSKELDDTKNELSEVEDELNSTKNELEDVKSDLDNTEKDLSNTNEDLKNTKDGLSNTNEELAITRDELNSTKKELNDLEVELSNIKNELAIVDDYLKDIRTSLGSSLINTKAELKITKEELNTTKENLEDEVRHHSDTANELSDDIGDARQIAYSGMIVGIIGIILVLIALILVAVVRKKVINMPPSSGYRDYPPPPPPKHIH